MTTALDRGAEGGGQTEVTSEARDRGGGVRAALVSRAADMEPTAPRLHPSIQEENLGFAGHRWATISGAKSGHKHRTSWVEKAEDQA